MEISTLWEKAICCDYVYYSWSKRHLRLLIDQFKIILSIICSLNSVQSFMLNRRRQKTIVQKIKTRWQVLIYFSFFNYCFKQRPKDWNSRCENFAEFSGKHPWLRKIPKCMACHSELPKIFETLNMLPANTLLMQPSRAILAKYEINYKNFTTRVSWDLFKIFAVCVSL